MSKKECKEMAIACGVLSVCLIGILICVMIRGGI
ncbi:hypothetical protein [Bacillus phage SRT01hs]|uniref:Uncharacterized protein n=1 Tax=Bacillus phage SRT01hs TaxID=2847044 RepID=A0A6B9SZ41_9CAUD|nr:hypothetical protein H3022_gp26 [Bacillus phage SRT01hs]QHJ75878.1 hypothetical protein [Bacillus phage SRT01hs]